MVSSGGWASDDEVLLIGDAEDMVQLDRTTNRCIFIHLPEPLVPR